MHCGISNLNGLLIHSNCYRLSIILAGLILAHGILGVHLLFEVRGQSNKLGLVIWDRLIPQACMLVVSVERRDIDNALRHIERLWPLNPLSPLCLDIIHKIRAAGLD